MNAWAAVAQIASGLNVVLLAALCVVWARNALRFRSKHPLGLLVFGALLLVENALSVYYYTLDPTLSVWFATSVPDIVWRATMVVHVVETFAVGFLLWVTVD
ncbi:hypothetical protein [Halogeometricum limi]|uniref:Histidine kinase N-terminal 7TM region domain-containing protein n=1 Tax=Halogeometricum limi TaxID=555875 RepID=A0A1I6I9H2_9EURY|nr:hypothetical protein [Halogeometricum limi]SFR63288.1 hypothetical protein SAMN04488124_2879 [Halogeometricum limi]